MKIVEKFINVYGALTFETLDTLDEIYDDSVVFTDPFHEICGIENLRNYFYGLYRNVERIDFTFHTPLLSRNRAFLEWEMVYRHKKTGNKDILVRGGSVLEFRKKIISHRGYFDAGEMLYEHLPLLGYLVRKVKAGV